MGTFRLAVGILRGIGFLVKGVFTVLFTVVAWFVLRNLVNSGELPPDPFGLGGTGLPETLLGLPITYAGALLVFAAMLLFGDSSGGVADDGHDGGFGGEGGGGGGDGGGGE
jgi:hypothetical protein